MARWTITIRDDEDDGRGKILRHVHADDMAAALWDFDTWLRDQIKYHAPGPDAQAIRDQLHEILDEHGIDLEEIFS
jgi:hypothetical protein